MSNDPVRTILYVANKKLPPNDYRIQFARDNRRFRIIYALPGRTEGLAERDFVQIGFEEGLSFADVAHFFRLARVLRASRSTIDVVHFFSTKLILFGPIVSRLAGVPSMLTVTGLGRAFDNSGALWSALRRIYLLLLRLAMNSASVALFQNRGDLELLARHLCRHAQKFAYVGSTVDMPVIENRSYADEPLRVLLVARIMPNKGIEDFLRVAAQLAGRDIEFMLVGPPSRGFDGLLDQVRAAAAQGTLTYRGELGAAETHAEFSRAHVFYFPSSYGEGMARVMLECGFAGLCPVAYDIPANRDLITPGCGYLLKRGDWQGSVAKILELAANREILRTNALAYQRHVTKAYSPATFAERMTTILERLPARHDSRAR